MTYQTRIAQDQIDNRFRNLKTRANAVVDRVQVWIDEATTLHTDTIDVAEKAEIIALRDKMIADLRIVLGV